MSISYLNTCERPLSPGTKLYPILIHGDLTPPGSVAHYITTSLYNLILSEYKHDMYGLR